MSEDFSVSILSQDQITIKVDEPKTDYVKVHYHVLPGCKPSASGHTIAYWENQSVLDFSIPPTNVFSVTTDAGTQTLQASLGTGSYVFAYSTRPYNQGEYEKGKSGFCAAGFVDPYNKNMSADRVTDVHLELVEYDTETVSVKAVLPQTYKPSTSGNWIGIWEGDFLYGEEPAAFAKAAHDKSEGTTLVNMKLKRDQTYVIVYGMGGYNDKGIDTDARKTAAATLTFRT